MSLSQGSVFPDRVIQDLNASLDPLRVVELIDYKSNKLQDGGDVLRGFCPIHQDGVFRTLVLDKPNHTFKCMYTVCRGSEGGNLIELYALAKKIPFDAAVKELARRFEIEVFALEEDAHIEKSLQMAENLLIMEQLDEAEKVLQVITTAHPRNVLAQQLLLRLYSRQTRPEQVLDQHRALAYAYLAEDRPADALQHARLVEEKRPDEPETMLLLAEINLRGGDAEGALYELMAVADYFELQGDVPRAIEIYKRADEINCQLEPELLDVLSHVLRLLDAQAQPDAASDLIETRAQHYCVRGNNAAALELIQLAMERDPARLELRRRFAEISSAMPLENVPRERTFESIDYLVENQEHEAAAEILERLHRANPSDEEVLRRYINSFYNRGMQTEATNLEVDAAVLRQQRGDLEGALAELQKLLEWHPEHLEALEALAEIEIARGNALGTRNAKRRLAKASLGQKDFGRALHIIDTLLENEPQALDVLEQKAQVLEAQGRARTATAGNASLQEACRLFEQLGDRYGDATTGGRAIGLYERASALLENPPRALLHKLATQYIRAGSKAMARDTIIRACETLVAEDKLDEAILEAERFRAKIPMEADLARYVAELYLRFDDNQTAAARLRGLGEALGANMDGAARQFGSLERAESEALEAFEQAIQINPDDIENYRALAQFHRMRGNHDRYLLAMNRGATRHEQRGDVVAAIDFLGQLQADNPADVATAARLVELCDRTHRTAEAKQFRLALAQIYREAGDFERELRTLREAASRAPGDQEVAARLAEMRATPAPLG